MKTTRTLATALVLAAALTACSSEPYDPNNADEAIAQCEGFTDSRLKAPADADYELSAVRSGNAWTVSGTVDSENGFGAKIRSAVTCDLHFEGGIVRLDDISIG